MAGHSKYNNIKHRKGAQDSKRSAQFTKLARDIKVAVKVGGGLDMDTNFKLRIAIQNARHYNVPNSVIENALHSKEDENESVEIIYNGNYKKFVFIIEASTNNKNRTSSVVKSVFSKNNGVLSETGSANFLFDHIGCIKYNKNICSEDQFLESIIELDILNYFTDDDHYIIEVMPNLLHKIFISLSEIFKSEPQSAELTWKAKDYIDASEQESEVILKIIDELEESEDVENVYVNANI